MKIQLLSDLHLEFIQRDLKLSLLDSLATSKADVLCLCGDTSAGHNLIQDLREIESRWPVVLVVPGNHEYYGSNLDSVNESLENEHWRNLYVLNNDTFYVRDQKFVGSTLWFDDSPMNRIMSGGMNDYRVIKDFGLRIIAENEKAKNYLKDNVKSGDIVLTHHLPLWASIDEMFLGDKRSIYYVSNMEVLIREAKPKLWMHGHSHSSADYVAYYTRILSNPRGYIGEENKMFNSNFILEI